MRTKSITIKTRMLLLSLMLSLISLLPTTPSTLAVTTEALISYRSGEEVAPDLSQRYVVFLGGINSASSEGDNPLNGNFKEIRDKIRDLGVPHSHFVYFSYSAQYHSQIGDLYCSGWGTSGCSTTTLGDLSVLNLSPVYTGNDTKIAINLQSDVLDWLLGQIVKRDPNAQIDLVGSVWVVLWPRIGDHTWVVHPRFEIIFIRSY